METKIIKVDPKTLKLLEVNARYMKNAEFQQLVENVKRDKALSSVPFGHYLEDGSLEVLSGNHRVQAAIEAGLKKIDIMVTTEKLSKSQKIGIQLSHNSIAGQDDMSILKKLYEDIDDIDYKAYSGLDDETLKLLQSISSDSITSLGLDFQILNIVVLPTELNEAKKVIKRVKQEVGKNKALTLRFSEYDKWLDTIDDVSGATGIKNTATAFLAMLGIIEQHLDELKAFWVDSEDDKRWIPISTIFGRPRIKMDDARIVNKAIEQMVSRGELKKNEKEKGLRIMAEKYLAKEEKR